MNLPYSTFGNHDVLNQRAHSYSSVSPSAAIETPKRAKRRPGWIARGRRVFIVHLRSVHVYSANTNAKMALWTSTLNIYSPLHQASNGIGDWPYTKDLAVSSHFQTLRRELKIERAVGYF